MRILAIFAIVASIAAAQDPAPPPTLEERLKKAGADGKSIETGEDLAEAAVAGDGLEWRKIKLPGPDIASTMVFSDTGGMLFLADRTGYVRKIQLPEWKELRRLWVGKPVTALAECKEGILATIPASKQMILIKEDALSVSYHWSLEEAPGVIAMPHGGPAWVPKIISGFPIELQVIDMSTHSQQAKITAFDMMKAQGTAGAYLKHAKSKQLSTFENITASPKGDFLMCVSSNCIFRLGAKGWGLTIEEAGPPLGNFRHIAISEDGNYVGAPAPYLAFTGWPSPKGNGSLIFKTRDLQKPTASVDDLAIWGFIHSAEKVYGIKEPGSLVVQTPKGKVEHAFELNSPAANVLAVEKAGDTDKYIVHLGDRILWVWFK